MPRVEKEAKEEEPGISDQGNSLLFGEAVGQ